MSDSMHDSARPTVSVCIPTYNSAATVKRCLDSVLAQQGVDFEIVVIDDDSADGTADLVEAMLRPGDRVIRNVDRLGLVGNHNRCIAEARGTYVQFVHADDWLLPGALAALVAELEQSQGGMAWAPRTIVTDDDEWLKEYGQVHGGFRTLERCNDGRRLVRQVALRGGLNNWVGEPTCVMFRRQLALDAGLFRDDIYQLLDLDLWLRLMLRSTVCFLPQPYSVRHHTPNTETARNAASRRAWLDQLRVLTTLIVDPKAPAGIRTMSAVWWIVVWIRSLAESVVFGPKRLARLRLVASAPVRELRNARAVFNGERRIRGEI